MEQAVNQFNQGLQLDTHPMVQGNNTLTDCLNGTLITMNGNEIVLQNDMGNRRVDNAFLPSGYEPVGMKEYGGIIYVAAYNPITNKSQIGSFPSPQKKINSPDDLPKVEFDINKFSRKKEENNTSDYNAEQDSSLSGIYTLISDSFLIPLTKDNVLRAGDKFAIYSSGLSEISEDLTNYNNVDENDKTKAISPKNKRYTIQAGILNSQNEFVDITKTLGRWKNDVLQLYDSSVSDVYKFNDGYFIANQLENILGGDTIADYSFIKERQKMAVNTYAYKLIGPLYLKISLNHIENFNYNIYGTYNKYTNEGELTIEGYITYNCPDGVEGYIENSNKDYISFQEGTVNFNGFDFYSCNGSLELKSPTTNVIYGNSTYNPETNLYQVKIVKSYTVSAPNASSGDYIYNYVLAVDSGFEDQNIYLKGLSVKGSIDLSLLGSGEVSVKSWRFYNNYEQGSTILSFALDAYPKYGQHFENLRFIFTDVETNNSITYPQSEVGLPVYNGKQTITIDWEGNGFEPRTTYKVKIKYDIVDDNNIPIEQGKEIEENIERWFLTTELFNDLYFVDNSKENVEDQRIEDYCTTISSRFTEKLRINSSPKDNFIDNSGFENEVFEGGLLSESQDVEYSCKHTYHIDITSNPEQSIENENLYPKYIKVSESNNSNLSVQSMSLISVNGNLVNAQPHNEAFKQYLIPIGDESSELQNKLNQKTVFEDNSIKVQGNRIIGDIVYYDRYVGKGHEKIHDIPDVFDSVYNIVEEASPVGSKKFGGIAIHKAESAGRNDDEHWLYVYKNMPHGRILEKPYESSGSEISYKQQLEYEENDPGNYKFLFTLSNYLSDINTYWKDFGSQMFIYLFPYKESNNKSTEYREQMGKLSSTNITGYKYARVWWRTPDGWALFDPLLEIYSTSGTSFDSYNKNFLQFIKTHLKHEYVYCTYPEYNGEINRYAPTIHKYYSEYSIPVSYQIIYGGDISSSIDLGNYNIGNLVFRKGNSSASSNKIDINLKSSENFIREIETFDPNNISLIDLKTCSMVDSEGNRLNKNGIYYYDQNNKLVRLKNNYSLQVDFENMWGQKNTLVYVPNSGNNGALRYRYDRIDGSADGTTNLDYANIPVVSNV